MSRTTMDDRTLLSMLGGAVLIHTSMRRAEQSTTRSVHAGLNRELRHLTAGLRHRLELTGALGGTAVGTAVLVYAYRRHRRDAAGVTAVREHGSDAPAEPAQHG